MKYLMVTKWKNVFVNKGEVETYYPISFIKNNTTSSNLSENIQTIFINTNNKTIFEGSYLRTVVKNNQKISFLVRMENQLTYNVTYDNKSSGWSLISNDEYLGFINPTINNNEKMVFITKANSLRISKEINPDKFKELKGEIYESKIDFFNMHEKRSLLSIKEFFKNPEHFIKELYEKVISIDTFKFVWEGGHPAYHIDKNCERLNKEYENFEIPEDIVTKGKDEVIKFRNWFEQNKKLLNTPDVFLMRLQFAFGIITNPKAIRFNNSGNIQIENYELTEIKKIIDDLLRDASNYYLNNEKTKKILSKYSKYAFIHIKKLPIVDNNTGYSDEDIYSVLEEFDLKFKKPIYNYLIEYYKVKLNPELKFVGKLLDQIGFKKCGTCSSNF